MKKKTSQLLLLLSLWINGFLFFNQTPDINKTIIIQKVSNKVSSTYKGNASRTSLQVKNGRELYKNEIPIKETETNKKEDEDFEEADNYIDDIDFEEDNLNSKWNKSRDRYLEEELEVDSEEINKIAKAFNKLERDRERFFTKRFDEVKEKYGDSFYMYGPKDYTALGSMLESARSNVSSILGKDKFNKFLKYIRKYNQGFYDENYVLIEF